MPTLRIVEIFESIQGESTYSGLPFTFVRLAGCNLRCRWCDTAHAQSLESGCEMELGEIMGQIRAGRSHRVCITGGEPLLQNSVALLCQEAIDAGFTVTLETNGSMDISILPDRVVRIVDAKCPSSGMETMNLRSNWTHLTDHDEMKFVIADLKDYEFARAIVLNELSSHGGEILFSPVDSELKPGLLAQWILKDGLNVRLQLQLHKMLSVR